MSIILLTKKNKRGVKMEKIYGYSKSSLKELNKFISRHKGEKKVDIFKAFAKKYNKKSDSVRNMYYALAKQDDSGLSVKEVIPFEREKEDEIIKYVLIAKSKNISVRKALIQLARGDMKLYLRYQNKYRVILKSDKKRIDKMLLELKESGEIKNEFWATEEVKKRVSVATFNRLSKEIDELIARCNFERVLKDNELSTSAITFFQKIKGLEGKMQESNNSMHLAFFSKNKN